MKTSGQTQTLHVERNFDCSADQLWAAWTVSEQFAKWINPFPGIDAEVPQLDPRLGGRIRFTVVDPEGTRHPEEGIFEALDPPRELVIYQENEGRDDLFDGHPLRMMVRIRPAGDHTALAFEQSGYPADFPLEEAQEGFEACLDKLEAFLDTKYHQAKREIVVKQHVGAPREAVFAAWLDRATIGKWWSPTGFKTQTRAMDTQPGGTWKYVTVDVDGSKYPNEITYRKLQEPRRIEYDHAARPGDPLAFHVTIDLEPHNKATQVTMRMLFKSEAQRDEMLAVGAVESAQQMLHRLDLVLSRR